jgi:hypothetical protein
MARKGKRPVTGRVIGIASPTSIDQSLHIEGVLDDGRPVFLSFAPTTRDPGVIARLGGPDAMNAERMRSLARTLLAAAQHLSPSQTERRNDA